MHERDAGLARFISLGRYELGSACATMNDPERGRGSLPSPHGPCAAAARRSSFLVERRRPAASSRQSAFPTAEVAFVQFPFETGCVLSALFRFACAHAHTHVQSSTMQANQPKTLAAQTRTPSLPSCRDKKDGRHVGRASRLSLATAPLTWFAQVGTLRAARRPTATAAAVGATGAAAAGKRLALARQFCGALLTRVAGKQRQRQPSLPHLWIRRGARPADSTL